MDQLSFFSAGVAAPTIGDLGGLLAAHGQITQGADPIGGATVADGPRLSVLVADRWRADALLVEFERRQIAAEVRQTDDPALAGPADPLAAEGLGFLVRSARSAELLPLANSWTRGSVKQAAGFPSSPGGFLRCWALASGRCDHAGYLLGLDPRSEHLHTRLASALAATGLAGVLLGARAGGPAVRIVGRRRLDRLTELVGDPPSGAPSDAFPPGR